VRHGRPEAWAAGAVIAVARVNGLLGTGRAVTAQQVADELEVSLGALAVAEQQLARALNLSSYATPPAPRWSRGWSRSITLRRITLVLAMRAAFEPLKAEDLEPPLGYEY
jgi:hypothetical protein